MAQEQSGEIAGLRRSRRSAASVATKSAAVETPAQPVEPAAEPPPAAPATAGTSTSATEPSRSRTRPSQRFWGLLVAGAIVVGIIVGAIAAYAVKTTAATYQSQALLEIDQPGAIAVDTTDGVIAKLSRLRYEYAGLVKTETFAAPVAQQLGVNAGAVTGGLYSIVDPSSLLLAVGARGHDAQRTFDVAKAVSAHVVDFARQQQNTAGIPAKNQYEFSVVTPAGPAVKVAPTQKRVLLVGTGAFLFVTLGTIGFGYVWRRDT